MLSYINIILLESTAAMSTIQNILALMLNHRQSSHPSTMSCTDPGVVGLVSASSGGLPSIGNGTSPYCTLFSLLILAFAFSRSWG